MNPRWATFARFLFSGGINTAFGYLSYAALVLSGLPLWLAVAGSTVMAIVFNFYSYGSFVFRNTSANLIPRFLLFYSWLGLTNYGLLHLLGNMGFGPLLAQAFLLPLLALLGYAGMRMFVFRSIGIGSTFDQNSSVAAAEDFKPVPVTMGTGRFARLLFWLRCSVDLQLLTRFRFVLANQNALSGKVLDVGCGQMPFRSLLADQVEYTGIDIADADSFGMTRSPSIIEFNGRDIPFPDNQFDAILCTEVLEHAEHPESLIAEMLRVLRPGGNLVLTVPFSARVHHLPYDFSRFTNFRLLHLFAPFGDVRVLELGTDMTANKIAVATIRQIVPFNPLHWPFLLLGLPASLLSLAIAHFSLWLGWGSKQDPLGYGLIARKM
jgi:SAM-dependent methyltransferase